MIGRATYGRPWIFKEIKNYLQTGEHMPALTLREKADLAIDHLKKSVEIKGERVGVLEMRRHLSNYFKSIANFKETRMKLVTLFDINELVSIIDNIPEKFTVNSEF
jgi:tRNA-dihydrouridine synthase B